jgi:hypothetical protein
MLARCPAPGARLALRAADSFTLLRLFQHQSLVLEGMLVPQPLHADLPRKDRRVEGEDVRVEVRVVNVPDDDHEKGHQPFVAVGHLRGGHELPRQDGGDHRRVQQHEAGGDHDRGAQHQSPVLELLPVVELVEPRLLVRDAEVVAQRGDRVAKVLPRRDER